MWSFVRRYGTSILLAVAPLLTAQYSLLDVLGFSPGVDGKLTLAFTRWLTISGPKPQVEMQLRVYLTLFGVLALLVQGYFDAYRPSRTLESFRQDYLEHLSKAEWRKRQRLRSDIRINVMYKRFGWIVPLFYFDFIWQDGFAPSDRDTSLRLYFFQGVCGRASRTKEAILVDLRAVKYDQMTFAQRWLFRNEFRLSHGQLRKTKKLKAILSIPIYERHGTKG